MKAGRGLIMLTCLAMTLLFSLPALAAVGNAQSGGALGDHLWVALLVFGAILGWGKITPQTVVENFGPEDNLAANVSLPVPGAPAVPEPRAEPISLNLAEVVAPWVRIPD